MMVAGAGGAATFAAGALPLVLAVAASFFGVGPAWAVWGSAGLVSLIAVLWLSTWAQAALVRAAMTDETARECLSLAWRRTPAFAWVLSLVLLAVLGGGLLLIVPGAILWAMLFAAPFRAMSGEGQGVRSLGLSWARVKPYFGTVAARLLAAMAIASVPGFIPRVGWAATMIWAPFGVVAMARLDKDLCAARPEAAPPVWMGAALAGLCAVAVIGTAAASFFMLKVASAAAGRFP